MKSQNDSDIDAKPHDGPSLNVPTHWFHRRVALQVVRHHLSCGEKDIRVAVGFFTVRGYNLIRKPAEGKRLSILVGVKEPGEKQAEMAIIKEIIADLRRGVDADRYEAVQDLVWRMKRGEFRIVDARALPHHAKLYLVDDRVALVGSSNLSQQGLIEAIEAGYAVFDGTHVRDYVKWYIDYFALGKDLTERLIRELEAWLQLAEPWDIYLKTLDALRFVDDPQVTRPSYRKPVGYQSDIIARALRHIEQHKGDMVVASTGLGKTIIGTAVALHLKQAGIVTNVLVIAPKAVAGNWKEHFRPTGISVDIFNPSALDAKSPDENQFTRELMAILERELDEQWLIIIDESHNFRNRAKKGFLAGQSSGVMRQAFKRLIPAIKHSGARVLELTATPVSTGLENVNDQLLLLPHTAPSDSGLWHDSRAGVYPKAWRATDLATLGEMEVASVITTPHVARYYGQKDPENGSTYIDFGGRKQYVPDVMLYRIDAPLVFEEEVNRALQWKYFTTTSKRPMLRESIERTVRIAWGSSPWALRDVISSSVEREGWKRYKVKFQWEEEAYRRSQQYAFDFSGERPRRKQYLNDLIQGLEAMQFEDDPKLVLLASLVNRLRSEGKKIAVFSELWATVAYLQAGLAQLCPGIRAVSLIDRITRPGHYKHKTESQAQETLCGFAPLANGRKAEDSKYDVFLATDAYGVGVNMQDAQVVINYDLAWTPIEPAQRAGRILRFWHEPRVVELFAFVPTPQVELSKQAAKIAQRWENLIRRDKRVQVVTDFSTLTKTTEPERLVLANLAKDSRSHVERVGALDPLALDREQEIVPVSPIFKHTAQLEGERDRVKKLSDDLLSAMDYDKGEPLLYILMRIRGRYQWGIYDINTRALLPRQTDLALLNLIACKAETPRAMVGAVEIEQEAAKAIEVWCTIHGVELDEVERVCTLYLRPKSDTAPRLFK